MREDLGEDLALPRAELNQAARDIALRKPTERLDKLRDDFAFGLRRVGRRG